MKERHENDQTETMTQATTWRKSDSGSPYVIVTGAAGFIGARLAESCVQQGLEVVGVDELGFFEARPELGFLKLVEKVDRDAFLARLEAGEWGGGAQGQSSRPGPLAVFHMGACSDTTQLDMDYLRRVNVEYSQRLWNHCARNAVPFFYASSAATYGDGAAGYDDDESRMNELRPLNPYGESKRLFDLWALEQERAGDHPPRWAGFKFFNVYGFGERHKGRMASVVLHSFDQIRSEGKARLFRSYREGFRDGEQRRDFVAVEDVIAVLFFAAFGDQGENGASAQNNAAARGIRRGIYNLGTGKSRTFLELAQAVFAALGSSPQIEFIPMPEVLRERYQYFTEARMERLRSAGYTRPFLSLEEGVRLTVARLGRSESGTSGVY